MALKAFVKVHTSDSDLQRAQENVKAFTDQLNKTVLHGIELKSITIGTSTTLVPHGLSREFQGWQILDIQGDARVWRDTGSATDKTKFLPLRASASVVINLWVF